VDIIETNIDIRLLFNSSLSRQSTLGALVRRVEVFKIKAIRMAVEMGFDTDVNGNPDYLYIELSTASPFVIHSINVKQAPFPYP
jgi:hypothetical protein